jgi:Rad3-related DNA helicase
VTKLGNRKVDVGAEPTPDHDGWIHNHGEYDPSDLPTPAAVIFNPIGAPPLPSWVTELREHQWSAAVEVVEAFNSGVDIVWLDAPTGAGKTLIAELVRRMLDVPSWYICSTKSLQDQFKTDFPYAKVLKGRGNYPTLSQPFPEYTANDCTKTGGGEDSFCYWCPETHNCPYEVAKNEALKSDIGIVNTSYFLAEANNVGRVRGRGLVISDECDVMERELMGFVTYDVSELRLRRLGISGPKKGVHKKTIVKWMEEELLPALVERIMLLPRESSDVKVIRERTGMEMLKADTVRVVADLKEELLDPDRGEDEDSGSNWVRDNDAGPLVLKPVRVQEYGKRNLWQWGKKWLCMSGSVISSEELNGSLGVREGGLNVATVRVAMTFPAENRPIRVVPVAEMSMRNKDTAWPLMAKAVQRVMEMHPEERILVHTVSYALSSYLHGMLPRGRTITYSSSGERDTALARYRRMKGGVLLAASMDRGIDLKDDDCRVVVVAKIPFPFLGDRQVGARLRSGREGQLWYDVQTIRTIIQMTGRGVRHKGDKCVTYILDGMFMNKVYKGNKGLLPDWWREAMTVERVKEFM